MKWAILLMMMCSTAFGQVSPEEAQARLKARQASASSQPSATVLSEYKQIVAELQAENHQLKVKIARLEEELKTRPPKPQMPKADLGHEIKIGMTTSEVDQVVGTFGSKKGESPDHSEQWEWSVLGYPKPKPQAEGRRAAEYNPNNIDPRFINPTSPRPPMQTVAVVYATIVNGKVKDFRIDDTIDH